MCNTYHLHVWGSVSLSLFTPLYNHHHCPCLELSVTQTETLCLSNSTSLCSPFPSLWSPLFCFSVCPFFISTSIGHLTSSLDKRLFKFFAHFWVVFFGFLLNFSCSLCVLDINPLSDMICKCLSPFSELAFYKSF